MFTINQNVLEAMSVSEKLQAIEALWATLVTPEIAVELPAWHEDVLFERKKKIESGQASFISLNHLKDYKK